MSNCDAVDRLIAIVGSARYFFPAKDRERGVPVCSVEALQIIVDDCVMAIDDPNAARILSPISKKEVAGDRGVVPVPQNQRPITLPKRISVEHVVT